MWVLLLSGLVKDPSSPVQLQLADAQALAEAGTELGPRFTPLPAPPHQVRGRDEHLQQGRGPRFRQPPP